MQVMTLKNRRMGKITLLLDTLKAGDRVVFLNKQQAAQFLRLAKERKLDIRITILPTKKGTHLDHSWVEKLYRKKAEKKEYKERLLVDWRKEKAPSHPPYPKYFDYYKIEPKKGELK